jgi:hypothetical protein
VDGPEPAKLEADPDGERLRARCRQGTIVVAAAVAEPVRLAIEPDERHQQCGRLDDLPQGRDRNVRAIRLAR